MNLQCDSNEQVGVDSGRTGSLHEGDQLILSRTVRFAINPTTLSGVVGSNAGQNGFGGVPRMEGFGRHYAFTVQTRGEPDSRTGYLTDIKEIDGKVRSLVVPYLAQVCQFTPEADPCVHMAPLLELIAGVLPNLQAVRLHLTPTYEVGMTIDDKACVVIRQQFDFAAAHRLHSAGLSDTENARLFGKCNNPHFHGHNYRVEVSVKVGFSPGSMRLADLEDAVEEGIIQPFDHKNLNIDCPEFDQSRGGVNPSVENIAKVFFGALGPFVRRRDPAAVVVSVQVWETEKTSAMYPG